MSTSEFKGEMSAGEITAVFRADFSNDSSALLSMAFSSVGGGNSLTSHDTATPGGVAHASLTLDEKGILEVWVVVGSDTESGRLTVSRNGEVSDDDATKGSTRWAYAIVP